MTSADASGKTFLWGLNPGTDRTWSRLALLQRNLQPETPTQVVKLLCACEFINKFFVPMKVPPTLLRRTPPDSGHYPIPFGPRPVPRFHVRRHTVEKTSKFPTFSTTRGRWGLMTPTSTPLVTPRQEVCAPYGSGVPITTPSVYLLLFMCIYPPRETPRVHRSDPRGAGAASVTCPVVRPRRLPLHLLEPHLPFPGSTPLGARQRPRPGRRVVVVRDLVGVPQLASTERRAGT